MEAAERRMMIIEMLKHQNGKPLSASALAGELSVSRQIIVGDIAILRAAGEDIVATARGYLYQPELIKNGQIVFRVACCHTTAQMPDELYTIVDQGCRVEDVIITHPLYGDLSGRLDLDSRYDVDQFVQRSTEYKAQPLSLLTEGVHLHTLRAPNEDTAMRVRQALSDRGYLMPEGSIPLSC